MISRIVAYDFILGLITGFIGGIIVLIGQQFTYHFKGASRKNTWTPVVTLYFSSALLFIIVLFIVHFSE